MSKTKAQLVEIGIAHGIKNAAELPYRQLETTISDIQGQSNGSAKRPKAQKAAGKPRKFKQPVKPVNSAPATAYQVTTHITRVELRKGVLRWYYVVKGGNGEVMSVSQKYYSRTNAERAAIAIAKANDYGYGVSRTRD